MFSLTAPTAIAIVLGAAEDVEAVVIVAVDGGLVVLGASVVDECGVVLVVY